MDNNRDVGLRLEVLGARGSNPVFGESYIKYGGSTSCYYVDATTYSSREAIILDAGSGIIGLDSIESPEITIVLSHSHLDHILGLPVFPYLTTTEKRIRIYLASRSGMSAKEQIYAFFSPPLWPCTIDDYSANVEIIDMPKSFDIGDVHVDTMESNHPGGSSIISLSLEGKKLVYATDYEHGVAKKDEELALFAKDADILMYDAQYTESEYPKYKGYGHSTPDEGLAIKEKAGAKELILIHHAPMHNDLFLYETEKRFAASGAHFAREKEVFYL